VLKRGMARIPAWSSHMEPYNLKYCFYNNKYAYTSNHQRKQHFLKVRLAEIIALCDLPLGLSLLATHNLSGDWLVRPLESYP